MRLIDADALGLNACWHCRYCNQDVNDDPCHDCFKSGHGSSGSEWEWEFSEMLEKE